MCLVDPTPASHRLTKSQNIITLRAYLYDEFVMSLLQLDTGLRVAVEKGLVRTSSELEWELGSRIPALHTELSMIIDFFL